MRLQHFENSTHVVVSVLRKGVLKEQVQLSYGENNDRLTLAVTVEPSENVDMKLAGKVIPDKCTFKCTPNKIELSLYKDGACMWGKLEAEEKIAPPAVKSYPSSAQKTQPNWDQIEKEAIEDDEKEKADSVDALFQKIYKDADEDTRRAMVKSFQESKGTVLSTNWSEIGKAPVEVKPPDGMEFKKYEQ